MRSKFVACAAALSVGLAWVTGCGGSGRPEVKTATVSGTVKLDGNPLEGAEVNFLAEKYAGVATTAADGSYELEAQPGENKVYIRKFEGVGPDFDETMMESYDDSGGGGGSGPRQVVPAKFSDPEKTELTFPVPEDGADNADFDLTSR